MADATLKDPKAPAGSRHTLTNRHSGRESVFEWTGEAWSTPGTGWGTKPSGMSTLGWRYTRPEAPRKGAP
jgi:hypothetical protein